MKVIIHNSERASDESLLGAIRTAEARVSDITPGDKFNTYDNYGGIFDTVYEKETISIYFISPYLTFNDKKIAGNQTITQEVYRLTKAKYDRRSHGNHKTRSEALTNAMTEKLKEELR